MDYFQDWDPNVFVSIRMRMKEFVMSVFTARLKAVAFSNSIIARYEFFSSVPLEHNLIHRFPIALDYKLEANTGPGPILESIVEMRIPG
jgi:hypothetical protein